MVNYDYDIQVNNRNTPYWFRNIHPAGTQSLVVGDGDVKRFRYVYDATPGDDGISSDVFLSVCRLLFDLVRDVMTLEHLTEQTVLIVEPVGAWYCGNVELRTVSVRTGISHSQQVGFGVLDNEGLVLEHSTIDTEEARSIVIHYVSTLNHEPIDDPVEGRALVPVAESAGRQSEEVPDCYRRSLLEHPEHDPAYVVTVNSDVKKHLPCHRVVRGLSKTCCQTNSNTKSADNRSCIHFEVKSWFRIEKSPLFDLVRSLLKRL